MRYGMCRQEAWQMGNVDCFEIVGVNSFYFVGHYTTVLEFAILGGCFFKSNLGDC